MAAGGSPLLRARRFFIPSSPFSNLARITISPHPFFTPSSASSRHLDISAPCSNSVTPSRCNLVPSFSHQQHSALAKNSHITSQSSRSRIVPSLPLSFLLRHPATTTTLFAPRVRSRPSRDFRVTRLLVAQFAAAAAVSGSDFSGARPNEDIEI